MLANTASQNLLMTERDAKYKKELSLCTDRINTLATAKLYIANNYSFL